MEQWKQIPGYEGIYEASDEGRIRSAEGKTTVSKRYGIVHWKQRILKQKFASNAKGRVDARITLWKDKKPHCYLVSRLIALTWCDGYFDGATVNHIDGNPLNNQAKNLEWVSLRENIQHGFRTGLYPQKVCVLKDEHDKEHVFRSLAEASRFLGYSNGYLSNSINKCFTKVQDKDGVKYAIVR